MAYRSSQARGRIGAAAASLTTATATQGSELCLRHTPQLVATPDPQPTEQGQGSNPHLNGYSLVLNPLSHHGTSTPLLPWRARRWPLIPAPSYSHLPFCPQPCHQLQGGLLRGRGSAHQPPPDRGHRGSEQLSEWQVGSRGEEELLQPLCSRTVLRCESGVSLSPLPSKASVPGLGSRPPLSLQLSIRCGLDRFKVYANGQHLFDFSHRLSNFQGVDTLEIQGDVTLSYVQI